jgi:hypothetical protein
MKLRAIKKHLTTYAAELLKANYETASKCFSGRFHGDDERAVEVSLDFNLTIEIAEKILSIAENVDDKYAVVDSTLIKQILINPDTNVIKSLKGFMKSFETYIKKDKIDGWIYKIDLGNNYMPYLVSNISHFPRDIERDRNAFVRIYMTNSSSKDGNSTSKSDVHFDFEVTDIHQENMVTILGKKGLYKENQELKNKYNTHLDSYEVYHNKLGAQFIAKNNGLVDDNYRAEHKNIKGDKLVNDQHDTSEMFCIEQKTNVPFFNKGSIEEEFEDEDEEISLYSNYKRIEVYKPFHPYIKMFNLDKDVGLWILADDIEPYEYDTSVSDKLILPDDHRDLIDVLVYDADIVLEDIVSNKSGGTSILCKGEAGLGKTLTAEVYSETVCKPLYKVHSGQLGTSPDNIDKMLDKVLRRAERWGAILLLDEADVYIRKRDNCMQHNAIVAAFLRQLERFNGIVFLTTNRSKDVDDAIVSRCIAVISYVYPEDSELFKIWTVLGEHYKIPLNKKLIDDLINLVDKTSGRDVKELLKLASKFKSQRGITVDLETFRKCAMFRGLALKSKKEKSIN